MNCLQSRRALLAQPRHRSMEHDAHVAKCAACARLATRLSDLDRCIESAALVPAPDALADRVILAREGRRWRHYAAAAALAFFSAGGGIFFGETINTPAERNAVQAVGPTHPAVMAIAEVANEEVKSAQAPSSIDTAELEHGLQRLGLVVKSGDAIARYLGKCSVDGVGECEHMILTTADGQANVMLIPDFAVPDRLLVADRRMVALVSPAGSGGYIVVAPSAQVARRMEKLLVRG